jgi:hypothetical protein
MLLNFEKLLISNKPGVSVCEIAFAFAFASQTTVKNTKFSQCLKLYPVLAMLFYQVLYLIALRRTLFHWFSPFVIDNLSIAFCRSISSYNSFSVGR